MKSSSQRSFFTKQLSVYEMQPLIFRGGPKNVFPSLEANLIFDLVVESNIFYGLHKKQTPKSSDV